MKARARPLLDAGVRARACPVLDTRVKASLHIPIGDSEVSDVYFIGAKGLSPLPGERARVRATLHLPTEFSA